MADLEAADDDRVTRLPRGHGVSAWRQIADFLEGEIGRGILSPGARLPTEAALAARFAVNRHTVRRALGVLAGQGLVRTTQGSGTFVEPRPLAYPIGSRTRFSEIVAAGGRDPGGSLLAAEDVAADAGLAAKLGIAEGAPVLRIVTLRRADGAPISLGTSFLPLPRFRGLDALMLRGLTLSAAFEQLGLPDYRRRETRIAGRPATAEEAARLELAPGRVVLVVESVNVDAAGAPVQATTAIFAADRVEIVVGS